MPATLNTITTSIPARLDRLPWSSWHTRIVVALGTSWLLDGLEVTLVGSLSGILESANGLQLTDPQVTGAATTYLAGAVCGALLFGYLTDRLGRRKLFLVTLATYSIATISTAFSFNLLSFSLFRFFTGVGIGGEYAAINSAVDELIPGKLRGTVDLIVNGTFWLGATGGSIAAMLLLGNHLQGHISQKIAWRLAFGIGGSLGLAVLVLRIFVPESPRWLMLRGYEDRANDVVSDIERRVGDGHADKLPPLQDRPLEIAVRDHTPLKEIFSNMAGKNRSRSYLALMLMVAQAFFFNAVFFSYGLVVKRFFHVSDSALPVHLLPFAIASFLGPLTLGSYLTVSEIFPLEIRAFAIAIFYALGTLMGGVGAPILFGFLIKSGSRPIVAAGYSVGALLMIAAAICEHFIGVEAAGKSLESISKPLQSN
jgi:MFS family permease